MITTATFYLIASIIVAGVWESSASSWKYEDEAHWTPLCQEGMHQSPIALSYSIAQPIDYTHFAWTGYGEEVTAILKNNGHSAEVRPQHVHHKPEVTGGGLPQIYQLDHLHFHWQSEHVVEDYRYPLELHMVHYGKQYGNLTNALRHPDGVAVFGVLFDLSLDDDEEFEPLLHIVHTVKNKLNHPTPLPEFRIKNFLPRNLAGYFRYDGSLTTPGCTEGIIWTVFTETMPISRHQVKVFEEMHSDDHTILRHNFRSLQPLNDRTLFVRISPIRRGNGSTTNVVSLLTVSLPVIALFVTKYL